MSTRKDYSGEPTPWELDDEEAARVESGTRELLKYPGNQKPSEEWTSGEKKPKPKVPNDACGTEKDREKESAPSGPSD